MSKKILTIILILVSSFIFGQTEKKGDILMTSHSSNNPEIKDILELEGIQYLNVKFEGKDLADKSFRLIVKEIWDGKIKSDSTIVNLKRINKKINSSILNLKVISKLTSDNKLKMILKFPKFFVIEKKFDAISGDYRLWNVAEVNKTKIEYGKKFYLLAYILPYNKNGVKSWCAVARSGKDIESWGKEFGIKHYLVFEMIFE